ncbi:hypothetical protein ACFODO_15640 [Acinetobacter sichuanensis]|uniref:Uncharacterized protein n=1 Tax=Acinetobacter sichuanensis TaxID=2136183 RepID=A0A371YVA9_9GAMM|nr:hypothetical protein [Acinetobacter sichuanensis]RFC85425.1 hypothetical protein C9E89_000435 [Acinetobacter sichuanensis]
MKPYFIKDDDGNYLNPEYIERIIKIRYSRLGSILVFMGIKRPKSGGDLDTTKFLEGDFDVLEWIENLTEVCPDVACLLSHDEWVNDKLCDINLDNMNKTEIHTALDSNKISHINSIYENNIFQYFEIVYIDSDQGTIKKFDSEELAQDWIAEHFKVI